MSKLKNVIKLHTEGKGRKFISQYLGLSKNTVKKYLTRFTQCGLCYQDIRKMSDRELYQLFQVPLIKEFSPRLRALREFFPRMQRELKRPGVTRLIMWEEYITKHPDGYGKTQFHQYYRRWRGTVNPSMRVEHKAGDKMYVDYAGKKMQLLDPQTGECTEVEVFVSILGASQLIYAEATFSQRKEDFITSVENAMIYYGGVPMAVVPDNLKSAITKSHRYEPTLNETFEDFAEHYGTTIFPARVYKPKDKSLVEGAVKIVYSAIYSALRNNQYTSLEQINQAFGGQLENLNGRLFRNRDYSRRMLFDEVEKNLLKPLPIERYELKETTWVTVMKTGHVLLQKDKHYYSVPYSFIGKKVKLVWSSKEVWIYHNYERLTVHKRVKSPYNYSTIEEHLASTHKFISQWNPDYFRSWARGIHPDVEQLIINILEKKKYPEQAYRSCLGVLGLNKKVGAERLSNACARALEYGICNYKIVQTILERGLDALDDEQGQSAQVPSHQNIRGKNYYS